MKMKCQKVLLPLVLFCISAFSIELDKTNAFDFLNVQLDARSIGLGGASSLIPGPGTAHWGNPALLSAYEKISFGGAFSPYLADVSVGGATGSYRFKNGIMIAPSFTYLSVGTIDGYDQSGDKLVDEIAPFSLEAGVAVSYKLFSLLSSGLSVSVAYENLTSEIIGLTSDVSASALLFDGGIYYNPTDRVAMSAGFRDLGFFMKRYEDDKSDLGASIYSGIRYNSRGVVRVNALMELEKDFYTPLVFYPGLEFLLYRDIAAFRIGTSFNTKDIGHFFDVLGGSGDEKHEYSKSDFQIISLGGGVKVPVKENTIFFDFATKILSDGMGLAMFFSGGFSF